jgi:stage II sporulation protein D
LEENAARFYKDMSIEAYDSHISWFRWNVHMTAEELTAAINANLPVRRSAAPALVRAAGDGIGRLVDIEILSRGEAGNIMEMRIIGTEGDVHVLTEFNVRMLLTPKQFLYGGRDIRLNRKDGTYLLNYSLMPSAFFVMDKEVDEDGNLAGITFHGGGNGHGVGMSQNGAKGMIDRGYSFDEVLRHFYPGTEVVIMM